ncbi:hypothetical protein BKA70DRAFT_2048 [Coprinopsis sp. MPI-PUGE-AT-0042]|nr:hypothetical protein BKA70DRAFT_2048 [Coprinopsis sp. MPI-PUGE-AT-0042]
MASKRSILSLPLPKNVLAALSSAGYTKLGDVSGNTAESLAKELSVPEEAAAQILALLDVPLTAPATMPMTQSVAALAQPSTCIPTRCAGLDKLLAGGLSRGHILEISGPPGSPKELVAQNIVIEFVENGGRVMIIDCQNVVDLRALTRILEPEHLPSVQYKRVMSLPELLLFFEQLDTILPSEDALLYLSSFAFPFQNPDISPARRSVLLQKVRQILAKATTNPRVTVLVTSQLATKFVNPDGSPGNFDSGTRGIMVPQLGSIYLPSGKSWRVLLAPDSRTSGQMRLVSSPTSPQNNMSEAYELSVRPTQST